MYIFFFPLHNKDHMVLSVYVRSMITVLRAQVKRSESKRVQKSLTCVNADLYVGSFCTLIVRKLATSQLTIIL